MDRITRTRFAPPEDTTKLSDGQNLDKCNSVYDSGCMDSGFHSGANLSQEQFVSGEIPLEEEESKNSVHLDSGLCLHEQLSSLNLNTPDVPESPVPSKQVPSNSPSPVDYFEPNEDGDT